MSGAAWAVDYLNSSTSADCVVTFNEVMYHSPFDDGSLEWVELHNQMSLDQDLSNWTLSGGIEFRIPEGTVLPAGGYLVLAVNPPALRNATGFEGALGPLVGRLDNAGDRLVLRNLNGRLMDELEYSDEPPWPVGPDGSGASLAKRWPDSPSSPAENWQTSDEVGGTPGRLNFVLPGTDPAPPLIQLIHRGSGGRWRVPESGSSSEAWLSIAFDDSSWRNGTNGFGYDTSGHSPLIRAARYYPLEGDARDASGNDQDATVQGGAIFNTIAPSVLRHSTRSLHFDGLDDQVQAEEPIVPAAYSLSLWVRIEELRACGLVTLTSARGPTSDWSHQLRLDDSGRFEHYTFDGQVNTVIGTTVAQVGRWYHVGATAANDGVIRLYVDGLEEGSPEPIGTLWTGGTRWILGSPSGHTPAFFRGWLDDVGIWHETLTATHLQTLAKGGSPIDPGGLSGLFVTDVGEALQGKNSSAWFRLPFDLARGFRLDQLTLQMRYDDGLVVWLNEHEIARRNAPTAVSWESAATTERSPLEAATPEILDLTPHLDRLVSGRNILAVQGLNVRPDDADFLVEVELTARQAAEPAAACGLWFSEVRAGAGSFWCELVNAGPSPLSLTNYVLVSSRGGQATFSAGYLMPGEFAILTQEQLGSPVQPEDRLYLLTADGRHVLDAVRVSAQPQARAPDDPTGPFHVPAQATPGAPNEIAFHDEIVINEILYHAPPACRRPGTPPEIATRLVLGWDSVWRYDQSGTDRQTAWRESAFDCGDWPSGPGILGHRTGTLAEPIRTPLALGQWTYYFRAPFVVQEVTPVAQLELRALIDDGAVLYLNGKEIYRQRMPEGEISHDTPAINVGDPVIVGPLTLEVTNLLEGINWLAAEVHQWHLESSDMVFGLELSLAEAVIPGTPDTPFASNEEQWIELYNRSDHAVDLGGWRFTDAINFVFPTDTWLAPDAYLVVARDAAALEAREPAIRVFGDFQRRLSNRSDCIRLLDAGGNLADQVRYYDGQPWPEAADGGGGSLELRNPDADNGAAGAWAASREASRSLWQHYTYTRRAVEPVLGPPLNGFHELRLGLLADGELLLDNVSVIEDPDGTRRELIQNGTFDAGADTWRLLGNHSHSKVIEDPDRPGNRVLHLVATDARGYLHNQIESTLKSGNSIIPVQAGREYQIAFDAKWLWGSPQLHTELYYNRVARTTILDQPGIIGTPGRHNSVWVPDPGPTYADLQHEPPIPQPGQPVTVSVQAADPAGVAALTLWYSVNGGGWQSLTMSGTTDGRFTATLPAQPASGTVIQFYVEGRNTRGSASTAPAAGVDSRALIRIDSRTPGPLRRSLHLILTSRDAEVLEAFNNMMSDDRLGATVIWDDREIFYDCGVHLHGSMFSRNDPNTVAYNIQFPADRLFRGVHRTVQVKRRVIEEIIAKYVQNQSGVPAMYDDIVHLFSHRAANAGAARMSLAHYNDIFLESQFDHGSDGTLFNMEGIRVAEATDNGTPEGVKLPFPIGWMSNYDLTDLGDDPEQYRWSIMIRNNRPRDDYAPYVALAKALSLEGAALGRAVPEVMDVDEWLRVFALLSLFGIDDAYTQGNPHNLNLYIRPADGRILALPYDWDFFFARGAQAPLWGNQNLAKVIALPVYTRVFYGHLLDLIETTFNADYLTPWVTHFGTVAGQDYRYALDRIRNRSAYVLSQLPAPIPFEITTNGGADLIVDTPVATLDGRGWIDVRNVRLAGQTEPLPLEWLDANRWRLTVPLVAGTNALALEAFNRRSEWVGQDAITVVSTGLADGPRAWLRITELMYHPASPTLEERAAGFTDADEFEFIELANLGPEPISLTGVRFTDGVQFDFSAVALDTLGPGACVLVVGNLAAFNARYGPGLPVAGAYVGKLDNGGETLRLVDRYGFVIQEFAYADESGWPAEADGDGPSLEVIDPLAEAGQPSNWASSVLPGGSPGAVGTTPPAFDRVSFDGASLRLEFVGWAGRTYRVLATDRLVPADWQVLQALPVTGIVQTNTLLVPWSPSAPTRFFQIVTP